MLAYRHKGSPEVGSHRKPSRNEPLDVFAVILDVSELEREGAKPYRLDATEDGYAEN